MISLAFLKSSCILRLTECVKEGGRKQKLLTLAVLFCGFILHDYVTREDSEVNNSLSTKEFFDMIIKKYGWRRQLDRVKLEDGSHVNVTDMLLRSNGEDSSYTAGLDINSTLIPELTHDNIDTSQWKIDKIYIRPLSYYHNMIEAIFHSDAIKMSRDSRAKVLSIGLGGGTINNFLHYVFPQMDITVVEISAQMVNLSRKWFGLEEDDHHRVEVADGIKFLAEKAKMGSVYDVILLDACLSDKTEGLLCPVESFLEDSVLASIAQSLRERGIFVTNALSLSMPPAEVYKYLTKRLYAFFHHCGRRYTRGSVNQVIYCTQHTPLEKPDTDLFSYLNDSMLKI